MVHAWFGTYALSAISVALDHCLFGNKAKSKFIEKTIFEDAQERENAQKPLSEKEIQRQRDLFVQKMEKWKEAFDKTHSK